MPATILIVDAIATNRILLKVKLNMAYHHVLAAESETDALANLRLYRPQIVVVGVGAEKLISAIRSDPAGLDVPIIAVGGDAAQTRTIGLLRLGTDEVLPTPVDEQTLLTHVRRLLRRRDQLHEDARSRGQTALWGMSESSAEFSSPYSVAFVSNPAPDPDWLGALCSPKFQLTRISGFHQVALRQITPEAIVLPFQGDVTRQALAVLQSVPDTKRMIKLVTGSDMTDDDRLACIDLGADAVFDTAQRPEDVGYRLDRLISVKRRSDRFEKHLLKNCQDALTDPLTGLPNRRSALWQLAQMAKQNLPYALVLLDVDHFKVVNDTFGHIGGDTALIALTHALKRNLRPNDICARIGGDEFLILLPDTDQGAAQDIADRLCQIAAQLDIPMPGHQIHRLSISAGLAAFQPCDGSISSEAQISAADAALYAAKRGGRNRCVTSQPVPLAP
jgi:two-component system cell cycle response regulator